MKATDLYITLKDVLVRQRGYVGVNCEPTCRVWKLYELVIPASSIRSLYIEGETCYLDADIKFLVTYNELIITREDFENVKRILPQ